MNNNEERGRAGEGEAKKKKKKKKQSYYARSNSRDQWNNNEERGRAGEGEAKKKKKKKKKEDTKICERLLTGRQVLPGLDFKDARRRHLGKGSKVLNFVQVIRKEGCSHKLPSNALL